MSPEIMADPVMHGYLRTAVIKGFEFTYALSLKFMERFLEKRQPAEMVVKISDEPITFHQLMRFALDYKLIHSIQQWSDYRKKRNITSHGYNQEVAEDILTMMSAFILEAEHLLKSLESQEQEYDPS